MASIRKGDAAAPAVCCVPAEEFVRGAVRVEALTHGWVRPWRFLARQCRALESCLAWYPGIFRQMATCTAGVRLEFETDASEVSFEVRVDSEPRATRRVLADIDGAGEKLPHDAISVDVDGRHRLVGMPEVPEGGVVLRDTWGPSITVGLDEKTSSGDILQLPGFGATHVVRVWLPALRGCELRRIAGNGTFIRPVSDVPGEGPTTGAPSLAAGAPTLVVLGDSVGQGFVTEDPALAWPSVVADRLGLALVNLSLGAQVFQPTSLMGLEDIEAPAVVVVALGANYRYGRCNERVVGREVAEFLAMVDRMWPEAGLVVLVPRGAEGREVVRGSCYDAVPDIIADAAERLRSRRVAAGHAAVVVVEAPSLAPAAQGQPADVGEAAGADALLDADAAQDAEAALTGEAAAGADAVPAGEASTDDGEGGGEASVQDAPNELVADTDGHPTAAGAALVADAVCAAASQLECRCLRDFGAFGRCGACVEHVAPEPEEAEAEPFELEEPEPEVSESEDCGPKAQEPEPEAPKLEEAETEEPESEVSEPEDCEPEAQVTAPEDPEPKEPTAEESEPKAQEPEVSEPKESSPEAPKPEEPQNPESTPAQEPARKEKPASSDDAPTGTMSLLDMLDELEAAAQPKPAKPEPKPVKPEPAEPEAKPAEQPKQPKHPTPKVPRATHKSRRRSRRRRS